MLNKGMFLFGYMNLIDDNGDKQVGELTALQNKRVKFACDKLFANTQAESYMHMDLVLSDESDVNPGSSHSVDMDGSRQQQRKGSPPAAAPGRRPRTVPIAVTPEGFWCCPSPAALHKSLLKNPHHHPHAKHAPAPPTHKTPSSAPPSRAPSVQTAPSVTDDPAPAVVTDEHHHHHSQATAEAAAPAPAPDGGQQEPPQQQHKVCVGFWRPETSDLTVMLYGKEGTAVRMSVHSDVLSQSSSFFAQRLAAAGNPAPAPPPCVEIHDCEDAEIYVETVGLMYCDEAKHRLLLKQSVPRVLRIMKAADALGFHACVTSCLHYLEAVPWVGDDEERSVVSSIRRLQSKDKDDDCNYYGGVVSPLLKRIASDECLRPPSDTFASITEMEHRRPGPSRDESPGPQPPQRQQLQPCRRWHRRRRITTRRVRRHLLCQNAVPLVPGLPGPAPATVRGSSIVVRIGVLPRGHAVDRAGDRQPPVAGGVAGGEPARRRRLRGAVVGTGGARRVARQGAGALPPRREPRHGAAVRRRRERGAAPPGLAAPAHRRLRVAAAPQRRWRLPAVVGIGVVRQEARRARHRADDPHAAAGGPEVDPARLVRKVLEARRRLPEFAGGVRGVVEDFRQAVCSSSA